MSRFDYVRYDEEAAAKQAKMKAAFENIEEAGKSLAEGRAKALFLTHLEVAYMWVGKAIRDEQIARGGSAQEVKERG